MSVTKEKRLAKLALTPRVGDNPSPENVTPGLIQLCRDWITPDCVMAEIGCYAGVSTSVFANFAKCVHAVDAWDLLLALGIDGMTADILRGAEARFRDVMAEYPNIVLHRGLSVEMAKSFPDGSLDAVYIDGAHDCASFAADVDAWRGKIKPEGLLMGHDFALVGMNFPALGLPRSVTLYPEQSWVLKV